MNKPCLFCQIIKDNHPDKIIYQDEKVTAFYDIHPQTPTHILIVPNKHIESLNDVSPEDQDILSRLLFTAKTLAVNAGIQNSGYRLILNNGKDAKQSVFHMHIHLMGGRPMRFDEHS